MKKKQVQNQAQDGRSMVEMLGVLAVIGVISLGGISGYRMAMNRYQANQIANEINLMRTDAKMKVAQGAGKLMLGEPYDSGHLNFGSNYEVAFDFADIESEDEGVTEAGYYIKISGISAGVCKPLVTLLNGMNETVALKVNDGEYSADSSADLCTEESNNALEVDFSTEKIISNSGEEPEPPEEQGDEPQECDPETCPGTCNDEGVCECPAGAELSEDGEKCACSPATPHWDGTECTACPEGSQPQDGKCVCKDDSTKEWKASLENGGCDKERVGECESNADCGPGEYCYLYYGNDCTQEFQSGKFGAGGKSYTSKCRNARKDAVIGKKTGFALAYPEGADGRTMNWWSAERFCNALGRPQARRESIGCGGVKNGHTCTSETWTDLRDDFSSQTNSYVWLEDKGNSCNAYNVALNTGNVSSHGRSSGNLDYALCE